MNVNPRRPLFYQRRRSNPYRTFAFALMILVGIWFAIRLDIGAIRNPFAAMPTPTRTVQSLAMEGDAFFDAGYLEAAINAYRQATEVDPTNALVWAKLARLQTYSFRLLTTDAQRQSRLAEALSSIDQAAALAPDDSTIHAIRAFVLDWNATASAGDQAPLMLNEAEQEAVRALQLDNQNVLALAFYAEILVDQQKWTQAEQVIIQAIDRDPSLMDVHRVYAFVLESTGRWRQAIEEYKKALEINPNLTFLYIAIGHNYRSLALVSEIESQQQELYNFALDYYARAVRLNDQLEIQDPAPYIAIAKTYSQQGEFFIAAQNILRAMEFDQTNADLYGQLGIIYHRARNFESAIPALQCAIRGCDPETSCQARFIRSCQEEEGVTVTGLPLSINSRDYYLVYGSVLAGLSRPGQNYCTDALQVLEEVKSIYGDNPIIAVNVNLGQQICYSLQESLLNTPTPYPTPTTLPTPKP